MVVIVSPTSRARPNLYDVNDTIVAIPDNGAFFLGEHEPLPSGLGFVEPECSNAAEARGPAWEVLEAQNPDYLECYACKSYHPLSDIYEIAVCNIRSFDHMPCMKIDQKYRTSTFIHPDFRWTVFRMIMKQYRLEGEDEELLDLLSHRSEVLMDGSQVKQINAVAVIIRGRLLMCVQTAWVVPPASARESSLYLANRNHLKCPHSQRYSLNNRTLAQEIVKKFAALETLPEDRLESLWSARCNICDTKFRVGLQRFKGEGTILFVTKYQDLGTGILPLESDIPRVIGTGRGVYFGGMGLTRLSEPLLFLDLPLPADLSSLTPQERQELFRRSGSANAQKERAKETLYWKWWGRQSSIWPYKFV